jgi:hypothetical protein
MPNTPFTNGQGQAYEMSRRIDDVGTQVRVLDAKFDEHRASVNDALLEIKTEITKVAATDTAVARSTADRQRTRELRYAFASTIALICSLGAGILTLVH